MVYINKNANNLKHLGGKYVLVKLLHIFFKQAGRKIQNDEIASE